MKRYNETWQQVADKYAAGEIVWSAELGGMGPGYEQCIQDLLFSILTKWPRKKKMPKPDGENYPAEYSKFVDEIVSEMNGSYGFSGAQVGAAKRVAYQFIKYGYSKMMNSLEDGRHIMTRKSDRMDARKATLNVEGGPK